MFTSPAPRSPSLAAAGVLGASAVALGAWGAHAGAHLFDATQRQAWQLAVTYQALHAVALIGLAAVRVMRPHLLLRLAGVAWTLGTLAFSGSLYVLALGGPRALGPVTPVGGVLLLVGWLAVAVAGVLPGRRREPKLR